MHLSKNGNRRLNSSADIPEYEAPEFSIHQKFEPIYPSNRDIIHESSEFNYGTKQVTDYEKMPNINKNYNAVLPSQKYIKGNGNQTKVKNLSRDIRYDSAAKSAMVFHRRSNSSSVPVQDTSHNTQMRSRIGQTGQKLEKQILIDLSNPTRSNVSLLVYQSCFSQQE